MVTKNVSKLSIKGAKNAPAYYGFQKRYQCVNMAGEIIGKSGHSNSVKLVRVNGKLQLPPI